MLDEAQKELNLTIKIGIVVLLISIILITVLSITYRSFTIAVVGCILIALIFTLFFQLVETIRKIIEYKGGRNYEK